MQNLVKQVIQAGGSITPLIIPSDLTNGTGLMNPSIYVDKGKLILNLRHVNYTLYHCEGEQLFNNRWGPLVYLNPENDIHLRTTNWLCELNDDLTIKSWNKVDTSKLDVEPVWEFIGLEDGRVVRWDDKLYLCGVRRDTKTNGEGRMELSELKKHKEIKRSRIEPPNDPNSYCEKNWMPVIDMPYHFVKWTNPTEVVKVDPETNTSETVLLKEGVGEFQNLRGGSQIIPYGDGRICIIHECDLWKNKLEQKDAKYTHRLVMWDKEWNIKHISEPFSFMGGEIEFCCGLAEYQGNLLISFGFQDNAAYILKMPSTFIESFFKIKLKNTITSKLLNFPSVHCISLADSKDRQNFINQQFEGISVPTIIQAFDGRSVDYKCSDIVSGPFFNNLDSGQIATTISHLKAIKHWYYMTAEPYGFFCEDDITLETVNNWNFTWNDIIKNLPKKWKIIQLSLIKDNPIEDSEMKLHNRNWNNWAAGAYILTRSYAKELLEANNKKDGVYELKSEPNVIPFIENVIYGAINPNKYTLPLFTENTNFESTFYPHFIENKHKKTQKESADFILDWWEKNKDKDQLSILFPKQNKKDYWKVTSYPTLEFTTSIPPKGCVIDCAFCPQRTLLDVYDSDKTMTLENFKKVIDKLPKEIRITFSGFTEPWLNKHTTDMLLYAYEQDHPISAFSTGIGMTLKDVERIKNIPFTQGPNGGFCLHLPDQERIAKHPITPRYIKVLEYFKSIQHEIQGFYVMCMGEVHDDVKHIFPTAHIPEFWSRAGNLLGEAIIKPELQKFQDRFKHMDHGAQEMTCGCVEDLYHNVVLPNGDVSLCCMDYGLKHIIGNIFEQDYDDIIPAPFTTFKLCQTCENGIKPKNN